MTEAARVLKALATDREAIIHGQFDLNPVEFDATLLTEAEAVQIRKEAARNLALLQRAQAGISVVRQRLADLSLLQETFGYYDADGRKMPRKPRKTIDRQS